MDTTLMNTTTPLFPSITMKDDNDVDMDVPDQRQHKPLQSTSTSSLLSSLSLSKLSSNFDPNRFRRLLAKRQQLTCQGDSIRERKWNRGATGSIADDSNTNIISLSLSPSTSSSSSSTYSCAIPEISSSLSLSSSTVISPLSVTNMKKMPQCVVFNQNKATNQDRWTRRNKNIFSFGYIKSPQEDDNTKFTTMHKQQQSMRRNKMKILNDSTIRILNQLAQKYNIENNNHSLNPIEKYSSISENENNRSLQQHHEESYDDNIDLLHLHHSNQQSLLGSDDIDNNNTSHFYSLQDSDDNISLDYMSLSSHTCEIVSYHNVQVDEKENKQEEKTKVKMMKNDKNGRDYLYQLEWIQAPIQSLKSHYHEDCDNDKVNSIDHPSIVSSLSCHDYDLISTNSTSVRVKQFKRNFGSLVVILVMVAFIDYYVGSNVIEQLKGKFTSSLYQNVMNWIHGFRDRYYMVTMINNCNFTFEYIEKYRKMLYKCKYWTDLMVEICYDRGYKMMQNVLWVVSLIIGSGGKLALFMDAMIGNDNAHNISLNRMIIDVNTINWTPTSQKGLVNDTIYHQLVKYSNHSIIAKETNKSHRVGHVYPTQKQYSQMEKDSPLDICVYPWRDLKFKDLGFHLIYPVSMNESTITFYAKRPHSFLRKRLMYRLQQKTEVQINVMVEDDVSQSSELIKTELQHSLALSSQVPTSDELAFCPSLPHNMKFISSVFKSSNITVENGIFVIDKIVVHPYHRKWILKSIYKVYPKSKVIICENLETSSMHASKGQRSSMLRHSTFVRSSSPFMMTKDRSDFYGGKSYMPSNTDMKMVVWDPQTEETSPCFLSDLNPEHKFPGKPSNLYCEYPYPIHLPPRNTAIKYMNEEAEDFHDFHLLDTVMSFIKIWKEEREEKRARKKAIRDHFAIAPIL